MMMMRAASLDKLDALRKVYNALTSCDVAHEALLEADESYGEYKLRIVELCNLLRCRLEALRTCALGHKNLDCKVATSNLANELLEWWNGHKNCVFLLFGCAAARRKNKGYECEDCKLFHHFNSLCRKVIKKVVRYFVFLLKN